MKRTALLALFLLCSAVLHAQTVKGVLTDEETGEAIPFANVVLDSTRYGVATDLNGFFLINKMPAGNYTLRVRFGAVGKDVDMNRNNLFIFGVSVKN